MSSATEVYPRFTRFAHMGKRKGVSAEEKRERIVAIYHDTKEPYNLKEIEQLGGKKGVGRCC